MTTGLQIGDLLAQTIVGNPYNVWRTVRINELQTFVHDAVALGHLQCCKELHTWAPLHIFHISAEMLIHLQIVAIGDARTLRSA